jgi:hypothetical protein
MKASALGQRLLMISALRMISLQDDICYADDIRLWRITVSLRDEIIRKGSAV